MGRRGGRFLKDVSRAHLLRGKGVWAMPRKEGRKGQACAGFGAC